MSGDDGRRPADDSTSGDDSERDPTESATDGSGGSDRDASSSNDADRDSSSPTAESDSNREDAASTARGDDFEANGGSGTSDETNADGPPPTHAARTARSDENLLHRFLHDDHGPFLFVREVLSSVGVVVAVGLLLFTISGVWPPMVAVESGSMEPNMHRGDLVFITEPGRLMSADATYGDTGVVTAVRGEEVGYRSFGGYGSVVVYDSPNKFGPPIIHRARFWVESGENWYDRADPDYVNAPNCEQLANCPAPHAGFITKGDANSGYDQAMRIAEPVKPKWITGTARVRVPYLGWIRLIFSEGFGAVAESARPAGSTLVASTPAGSAPAESPSVGPTLIGSTPFGPAPTYSLGAQSVVDRSASA